MTEEQYLHVHESPKVVTVPLIALAICSVLAGYVMGPMIYGGFFDQSIYMSSQHPVMEKMAEHFHGVWSMVGHGFFTSAFLLLLVGSAIAYVFYSMRPDLLAKFVSAVALPRRILEGTHPADHRSRTGADRGGNRRRRTARE